jgi:uncharacterized membrane protein YtjA (UPF0391 family)
VRFFRTIIGVSAILDLPVYLLSFYARTACGDVCPGNAPGASLFFMPVLPLIYVVFFVLWLYMDSNQEKFPQAANIATAIATIIFLLPLALLVINGPKLF